jgi:hypothetical protein
VMVDLKEDGWKWRKGEREREKERENRKCG